MKIFNITDKEELKQTILFVFRESDPLTDLEKLFPGRIDQFASELSWLYFNLNQVINHKRDPIPEIQMSSAFIVWNCCNTVSGAIETFGRGYVNESISLLRNVIESVCVVIHISKNSKIFQKIKTGEHDPKQSIHHAKKTLPTAGKLWGFLSQMFNHFNYDMNGTSVVTNRDGQPNALFIGGGFDSNRKSKYTILLAYIDLVLSIVRNVTEQTFYDFVTDFNYWKKEKGVLVSNLGEEVAAKNTRLMSEVIKASSQE